MKSKKVIDLAAYREKRNLNKIKTHADGFVYKYDFCRQFNDGKCHRVGHPCLCRNDCA